MFNYTDSKLKTQILPTLNAHANLFQSLDQQQWLLGHIDEVRVIFKDHHWNNDTSVASIISKVFLTPNRPQQQMVLNLTNGWLETGSRSNDEDIASSFERIETSVPWKTKFIEKNNRKSNESILVEQDLIKRDRPTNSNNYVVVAISHESIFNSKKPTDYLPLIYTIARRSASFDKDDQTRRKKQRINLIKTPTVRKGGKDNKAKEMNDIVKVEPLLFASKVTKSAVKQRLKYSLVSKLQYLNRIFSTRRTDTLTKEDDNHSSRFSPSSIHNRASKLQTSSFSSSQSPIAMPVFRGQTCDRSTSAYASKRRVQRINRIEQSTPRNILARVAEKLNQNRTELNDNRDYRTASKTVKDKAHSTDQLPSNVSDIYIKLSDCQAACRRWTAKDQKRNQLDRFPSPSRSRKTKRAVCYRDFPLSLNAQSKSNNIRREYFLEPTDDQLSNRMESEEDIEKKTSENIRKVSSMKMYSNAKVHDYFTCFGTASTDFVDKSSGPISCLRQGDANSEERIGLYRRISNDQLDFRNEREQTQHTFKLLSENVINSIEVDDEGSFQSVSRQFSDSRLASAHILRAAHECDIHINLVSSLFNESVVSILYQSPLQATMTIDMIPSFIITSINCRTRALMIQTENLPSIFSKSDAAYLWQRRSLLNVMLINDIGDVQADQKVLLDENLPDRPDISEGFNSRPDQFDQNSKDKQNSVNRHPSSRLFFELPSPANLLISEEKITTLTDKADDQHIIPSIPWNSSDQPSWREELDLQSITDYDQNKSTINLINTEETNDKLHSSLMIATEPFPKITPAKRTNKQDAIHDFEPSSTRFISEQINDQSVESTGRISAENNHKEQDLTERSLSLGKISHSLKSGEVSTTNANTEYLSMEGETSSVVSEDNHVTEENEQHKSISLKKSLSLDEEHITIPRCLQLCDSFKQTIRRTSDILLSTTTFPKHSSAEIQAKTSPTQHQSESSNDEQNSSHIDKTNIYQNEDNSIKRVVSHQSEAYSSDWKKSLLSEESFSETNNSLDNTDLQSASSSSESFSTQLDSAMQKFDRERQSIAKLETSRIMEIPRKLIDNAVGDDDLNSVPTERKYDVQSQFSDDEEEKFSISASSPIRRKPTKRKKKRRPAVIRTKCTHRQKFIRPSWVSVYKTAARKNYPLHKPNNRTICVFAQPNDPCQSFDIYKQFQHFNCRPYRCICTHLPPCFGIENVHLC